MFPVLSYEVDERKTDFLMSIQSPAINLGSNEIFCDASVSHHMRRSDCEALVLMPHAAFVFSVFEFALGELALCLATQRQPHVTRF